MSLLRDLAAKLDEPSATGCPLAPAALDCLSDMGLTKAVYMDLTSPAQPRVVSNAGARWEASYQQQLCLGDDPFPANCLSRSAPVLTGAGHIDCHPYLDGAACAQIEQASAELGIRTGLSITINVSPSGAGIGWNLMGDCNATQFAELAQEKEAQWRMWAQLVSAHMRVQPADTPQLSNRERDCLAYIADGLRNAAVAYRLGVSDATVEFHLRNARNKLGAATRDQAVAFAVRSNLI